MRRTTTLEVAGRTYNVEYLCPSPPFPHERIVITGVFRADVVQDLDVRGLLLGTEAGARMRELVEQEGSQWIGIYSPGVTAELRALEHAPDEALRRLAAATRTVLETGGVDADGFRELVCHRVIIEREETYLLVANRELRVWAVVDAAKVRLRLPGLELDIDADREATGAFCCGYLDEALNDADLGPGDLLVWLHGRGYSLMTHSRPAKDLVKGFFLARDDDDDDDD